MDGPRRRSVALAILFAFACDSSISPSAVQTAPVFGKVAVTTKAVTLVVGQEQQLSIKSSDPRVRWQSDNAASVSVSATGLVVARAPGVAHIVVRDQSAADTATVTVRASPDGIALVADSINIALGQSATLAFRALDASGAAIEGVSFSASQVRWTSTAPSIATVDSVGRVSALTLGSTGIVLNVDGSTDTAIVNVVPVAVATVVLSAPSQFSISIGSSYKITAVAKDAAGNDLRDRTFAWSSSDGAVATVAQTGAVTGVGTGSTQISVSSEGQTTSVEVTVLASPVATVAVSLSAVAIDTGRTTQATAVARDGKGNVLTGRSVLWSSDSPAATVSSLGVVKGVGIGTAEISALVDGVVGFATIRIGSPAVPVAAIGVAITPSTLAVGQTGQAVASTRDSAGNVVVGKQIIWSTSNASVAAVSGSGAVTGLANGTATITATSEGKSASASLNVTAAPAAPGPIATIGVSLGASNLLVGQSTQATAAAMDAGGNVLAGQSYTWTSSNNSVATVSQSGVVSAVGSGSSTIAAAIQNVVGSASISVGMSTTVPSDATLASHDFEDGTLGPYWNPWGTGIDVVNDPSNSGHGKVARIHYAAAADDDNRALAPTPRFSIGLGDSIWFRGDFYLPPDVIDDPTLAMRKLIYWGLKSKFPHEFSLILALAGPQLEPISTVVGPSNLPLDYKYTGFNVTKGQWHRLEIQLKLNSTFAAQDGILRIWMDHTLVYDRTNMRWTDPAWTDDPSTYRWETWGVGYQMQMRTAYDEYRYWDNVAFAKTRLP